MCGGWRENGCVWSSGSCESCSACKVFEKGETGRLTNLTNLTQTKLNSVQSLSGWPCVICPDLQAGPQWPFYYKYSTDVDLVCQGTIFPMHWASLTSLLLFPGVYRCVCVFGWYRCACIYLVVFYRVRVVLMSCLHIYIYLSHTY